MWPHDNAEKERATPEEDEKAVLEIAQDLLATSLHTYKLPHGKRAPRAEAFLLELRKMALKHFDPYRD